MEQYLNLPPDGAAHGPAIDHLIGLVHWLMLLLFIGWGTFYILTLIRFRRSKHPKASYDGVKSHVSSYLEVGVLTAEVILLLGFSIPLWSKRVDAFPAEKDATVIRIVAEQFSWNIHYPGPDGKFGKTSLSLVDADNPLGLDRTDPDARDDITTINQLTLPVGKPVIIHLSSKDVIHSLNLPAYRVKQDAIPGMSIPVWFTPTKTTDQVRDELVKTFSVAGLKKKVETIALPPPSTMALEKGMNMGEMVAMQDYADQSGQTLVAKNDKLSADNIEKLTGAGIASVSARRASGLDRYISMETILDKSGSPVVAKNDLLTEDVVTKVVEAGRKDLTVRKISNMDIFILMQDCADQSGNALGARGDAVSEDLLTKLSDAGINEIRIAPATPTEIACAQLCGLGHYRMRGYMSVLTPDKFQEWYNEQEAALAPASVSSSEGAETGAATAPGQAAVRAQQDGQSAGSSSPAEQGKEKQP